MRVIDTPIVPRDPTVEQLESAGFPDHRRMTKKVFDEFNGKYGPLDYFVLWERGQDVYIVDGKKLDAAIRAKSKIEVRG